MAVKAKTVSAELLAAREKLAEFIAANPGSSIEETSVKGVMQRYVDRPWSDQSLAFLVPDDDEEMVAALNQLILPERLTAVFHKDSKKLEVIWTAYELPEEDKVISGRAFKFNYAGKSFKCHFSRSSDRLLKLAEHIIPLKMSMTSFRNMQSFNYYVRQQKDPSKVMPSIAEPISFWIEGIEWDIEFIIELINNLNFYLSYYDNDSPKVLLHQLGVDETPEAKLRYISNKFPKIIYGKKLDNNLLSFWEASSSGDSARRFQYYYRIIEYASFFYLEGSARTAVRRILSAPDAMDDMHSTTDKLMAAFQMSKLDDYAKFSQLIIDTVDPKILWCVIKENLAAFSKEIRFDGGFILKPIVSATAKESTFAPKGLEIFTKAIRDIRNALSHGRDFKSASVIMPTAKNLRALQPWVHLIGVAAGQVVLYKDVT